MFAALLNKLVAKENLDPAEASQAMTAIMTGAAGEACTAALLVGLRSKGETATEVTAFARSMRKAALSWPGEQIDLCDTCGTGGDSSGTLNISTLSALLLAALGHRVAKHGNRAVSSSTGSADLLEELGLKLDRSPDEVWQDLRRSNICFLFAPLWHPAMKNAVPVRRALGIRTVFNLLGPLTNPAPVSHQIVGVFQKELLELVANALAGLDRKVAFVVHSSDGLDEITPAGETDFIKIQNGVIQEHGRCAPEDFGVQRFALDKIKVRDKKEALQKARALILGQGSSADNSVVAMNAALLHASISGMDLKSAFQAGLEKIQSGELQKVLHSWIERTALC